MYSNKVNCTFLSQNQSANFNYNEPFTQVKEINACRPHISKGPPNFCIELEADWLIILDEVRRKSPGILHKTSIYLLAK